MRHSSLIRCSCGRGRCASATNRQLDVVLLQNDLKKTAINLTFVRLRINGDYYRNVWDVKNWWRCNCLRLRGKRFQLFERNVLSLAWFSPHTSVRKSSGIPKIFGIICRHSLNRPEKKRSSNYVWDVLPQGGIGL